MPGKKKVKKRRPKSPEDSGIVEDPIAPITDRLGIVDDQNRSHKENLKAILTEETVDADTKIFMGYKVSTRVLTELTPHEIRDLKTVFEVFADEDKQIGAVSVQRMMRALGFKLKRKEAREMIADMDLDKNGLIDFNEFLQFVIDRQGTARDIHAEIEQGFKMFDYAIKVITHPDQYSTKIQKTRQVMTSQ
ncbi:caltractin-like isoform X2 [Anneissia japonica]|uniref:caltractin-like isoform X2 n=1 Tax=Anneissia japonica TaxID=1529436 RepID=UPI0014256C37|nr:caltractin-like isoform X2 [Anneissia japonica]